MYESVMQFQGIVITEQQAKGILFCSLMLHYERYVLNCTVYRSPKFLTSLSRINASLWSPASDRPHL